MEVHHHSHPPAGAGHRKKWTHYFWEFLMLFLAVFCGFLAENQREHYVEAHRAKEYAKSLLSDMKEDTTEISGGIAQNTFMIKAFDSCVSIGQRSIDQSTVPGVFYYYSRFTSNAYAIDWNRSTLTQLIQSGNLRYFKNKELVRKINKYYSLQNQIGSNNDADHLHRDRIIEIRDRLLAARYYEYFAPVSFSAEMKGHVPESRMDSLMAQQLSLKAGSTGIMEEYLNNLMDRKWRNKRYVDELYPEAMQMAVEIIEMLKEDYHFK
ncbi:MAG: hypothetical protein IPG86_07920 [Chitinophagaceae bacterium]|nr:hypothetical protein [Chitinophagaceae bacterium]